jgi:hypothetical protein
MPSSKSRPNRQHQGGAALSRAPVGVDQDSACGDPGAKHARGLAGATPQTRHAKPHRDRRVAFNADDKTTPW